MSHGETTCFHCGLPVPDDGDWQLEVDGKPRRFCCPGCRSVCETILQAGLAAYYEHRSAPGGRGGQEALPEVLEHLRLYDRPEVQASFVRDDGHTREASLILEEIRCPACLWLNEQHLRGLKGVVDVAVDYSSERAWVRWEPQRIHLSQILRAIADIGYTAHPYDPAHREELAALQHRRNGERLLFSGILGMPVMQIALATYLAGGHGPGAGLPLWVMLGRWSSLLAATAILIYAGKDFFVGAWQDLRRRRLGMDVPIVLGLGTAYLGSLAATVQQHGEVYYDSIVMFVFFVLLARRLELRGRRAAAGAVDQLAKVIPQTARSVAPDGTEHRVPVVDLQPGDHLRIRPGETIPVDVRLQGTGGRFDESIITGESRPVYHEAGTVVPAGARNADQPVLATVFRAAAASTLNEMRELLERGLRSRPPSAVLADRVAGWFVAAVLSVAAVTVLTWLWLEPTQALPATVAVLIVTCPCALALATPVALTIATSRSLGLGVLPLRSQALESLAAIQEVALDKTGTLTRGRLELGVIEPLDSTDRGQALAIAAALQAQSEHPIAAAFQTAYAAQGPSVQALQNHPGEGVSGQIDGRHWRLGRPEFALAGQGLPTEAAQRIEDLREDHDTVVVLADEEAAHALFALVDEPRPGVEAAVAQLRAQGVEGITVLSGDHPTAVARATGSLDVDETRGGMAPADKLRWLSQRQSTGRRVAMVGDGINDAATLAQADCSIAVADAADLAKLGSDMVLLNEDLSAIAHAQRLAARTRAIIRQNLLWAAGYNLLAVPVAAMGLIPPWAAALGMSLSSLAVVANALRLRRSEDARLGQHAKSHTTLAGPAAQTP